MAGSPQKVAENRKKGKNSTKNQKMTFLSHGKPENICGKRKTPYANCGNRKAVLKSCGKRENTQKTLKSGGKPENRKKSYGKPKKT